MMMQLYVHADKHSEQVLASAMYMYVHVQSTLCQSYVDARML